MKVLKLIILEGGAETIAVAEFNNGCSHIIEDGHCWVIVNGRDGEAKWSSHIFPEAMQELRRLPDMPARYQPLTDVLTIEGLELLRRERLVRQVMES